MSDQSHKLSAFFPGFLSRLRHGVVTERVETSFVVASHDDGAAADVSGEQALRSAEHLN